MSMMANISSAFCTGSDQREHFPLHAQCEQRKKQVMKAVEDSEKQRGLRVAQPSGALPAPVRGLARFPSFR